MELWRTFGDDVDDTPCSVCQPHEDIVRRLVQGFFEGDERKTELWMTTANPGLGNIRPIDLLKIRPDVLLSWVKNQLAENTVR